jgi:hypothetical protein
MCRPWGIRLKRIRNEVFINPAKKKYDLKPICPVGTLRSFGFCARYNKAMNIAHLVVLSFILNSPSSYLRYFLLFVCALLRHVTGICVTFTRFCVTLRSFAPFKTWVWVGYYSDLRIFISGCRFILREVARFCAIGAVEGGGGGSDHFTRIELEEREAVNYTFIISHRAVLIHRPWLL